MIYLDYSATTPVNSEVLDSYVKVTKEFIGNANSIHNLGVKSKELLMKATTQIAEIFDISEKEIIYTSGASESNTTAIWWRASRSRRAGWSSTTVRPCATPPCVPRAWTSSRSTGQSSGEDVVVHGA